MQHTVAKFRRRFTNTERPTQRYDASKLPETTFGTEVRDYSAPVGPSFLFAPDAEFGVADTDLDLFRGDARQLDAYPDQLLRFTEIDGRRPGAGDKRILG